MLGRSWYTGNAYSVLLLRLLLVLVLLFFSRAFIYFFNLSLFSDIEPGQLFSVFLSGLRFDLSTLASVNIAYIILISLPLKFKYTKAYQWVLDILFYILNSIALMLNFIDIIYFRFTGKRMTFDIVQFTGDNKSEIISLIPDFIMDFWHVFTLFLVFVFILIYVVSKIRIDYTRIKTYRKKSYLFDTVMFILIIGVFLIFGRGGFQLKPLDLINAGEYTDPEYFPILFNTPFTIIKTNDRATIKPKQYFPDEESLQVVYSPVHKRVDTHSPTNNTNIVIIILESFTAEHSAFLNPELEGGTYKGYTPFLDSLMEHSLVFKGFANGEKSIDGIPAILSGIPSLMNSPYLNSPYVSNNITSIAGLLGEKNYRTAFFHGGSNGTMSFESYTRIAGFDNYYGRTEFDNDDYYDGNWGIFDEPFLQFTAQTINNFNEPFFATIFTLSSHHPYTIPEQYQGKFRKGPLDIHESVGYSDYALRKFFETIQKMDWFENTLFVITADHTYSGYFPFYRTSVGRYSIPMVFYQKTKNWNSKIEKIAQQCDIMPSVLDYVSFTGDYVAYGQSVFDTLAERFAISYLSGIYQLIQDDFVYKFDGEKDVSFYDLSKDSLLRRNLIKQNQVKANHMSELTKGIIQQYNNRILENQLVIKKGGE